MPIEAVFFDIDGTLIPFGDTQMPASTIDSIQALHDAGIPCFLATGRDPKEIEGLGIEQAAPFEGGLLMTGGYCVYHGMPFQKTPMQTKDSDSILKDLIEHSIWATVVLEDQIVCTYANEEIQKFYAEVNAPCPKDVDPTTLFGKEIYQISPFCPNEVLDRLVQGTACKYTFWGDQGGDIIPQGSGKGQGILAFSKYLNIPLEHMMAFGDAENDQEMFRMVGVSVAMGNAPESIQALASYVTTSAKEDGIQNALKHYGII